MSLKVLLVDADPARAQEVAAGLVASGCTIAGMAREPVDLPRLVRDSDADVIVCDLDNPGRDAIESMHALNRETPRPVVMFVDQSDAATIAEALAAGVAAYVIEGLAPGRVRSVIDVAIARFRAHRALQAQLEDARTALNDRKLIERAKGALMQSQRITEDEAYRTLRRLAMDQGKRLADVAGTVIAMTKMLRPPPSSASKEGK